MKYNLIIKIIFANFIVICFFYNDFVNIFIGNDIWWHLKSGEIILSGGGINTDYFSVPGDDISGEWVNHSWLSQVIYTLLYNTFGASSLLVLRVLLFFLIGGIAASDNQSHFIVRMVIDFYLRSHHVLSNRAPV